MYSYLQVCGVPPLRKVVLLLGLGAVPALSAIVADQGNGEVWPYSPQMNWSTVPTFFFATTNLSAEGSIDPQSMAFLQRFPLIIMPKIQGPNTRNLTNPARPAPGCCAEDRIERAATYIKKHHRNPDVRVLMYISSCRLYPYYRLTSAFDEEDLLRHQNGSRFTETIGGPGQQWWYNVHMADFTQTSVTAKYLDAVRASLANHNAIDGVFADSSGDLRVVGGANMHLNQTIQFEAAWNAGHANMLTQLQAIVNEVLGPQGLLVANNADRPAVHGRNFETLGPTAGPYVIDEMLINRSYVGDSVEAIQHEELARRVSLIRGGYYTKPGSAGWKKGYANCLPPSAFSRGSWDPTASQIFNRTLAAFLVGAGYHSLFQCTAGYVGNHEYRKSFEDYPELLRPLGEPLAVAKYDRGAWTREFKAGVKVFLSKNWSNPCVKWSDGSITGSVADCASYTLKTDDSSILQHDELDPNGKFLPFDIEVKQIIKGQGKLPDKLDVIDRRDIDENPPPNVSQYKPWISHVPTTGELILTYRDDSEMSLGAGGLVIRRSRHLGAPGSWSPPELHPELRFDPRAPFKSPDGEWSIHALSDGTILLVDGSCSMWRSDDGARRFQNISGMVGTKVLPPGTFHFNSSDECGSFSVLELEQPDHDLPAGIYYFADQSIWRSGDAGRTWKVFVTASNSGDNQRTPIHNFPAHCGLNNGRAFFFQSEVYRRQDGTFLHGTRVPCGQTGDWFDSSQLWQSKDARGEEWGCISMAASGYCDPSSKHHIKGGCYTRGGRKGCVYDDLCSNMTWENGAWLKPGSMYTHFLRLHDKRLLMTWTKRIASLPTAVYDDDGYGAGTRGLLSYDDGSHWTPDTDYIVIQAQNDSWNPVCRHGGPCRVGFGNTIQLPNGTLVSVYCRDTPTVMPQRTAKGNVQNQILVSLVRWNLPPA